MRERPPGLAAMDYLLSDRHIIPEGSEDGTIAKTSCECRTNYLCFDPPENAYRSAPPPSLKKGFSTFGSFNNLAKVTPEVVATWAKILRREPTARFVMKYRGLVDRKVQKRFLDTFADHGVGSQRLELLPVEFLFRLSVNLS